MILEHRRTEMHSKNRIYIFKLLSQYMYVIIIKLLVAFRRRQASRRQLNRIEFLKITKTKTKRNYGPAVASEVVGKAFDVVCPEI